MRLICKALRDVRGSLTPPEEVNRTLVVASTPTSDRMGDVVAPSWDLEAFKENPVILWGHDHGQPPIGRAVKVELVEDSLVAEIEWDTASELGATVARQFKEGFLNAVSVGFKPGAMTRRSDLPDDHLWHAERGMVLSENELLEISAVSVPANQEALAAKGLKEGLIDLLRTDTDTRQALEDFLTELGVEELFHPDPEPEEQEGLPLIEAVRWEDAEDFVQLSLITEGRAATGSTSLPLADEALEWDWDTAAANEVLAGDDWERYRQAHFWYDPERAETKAGYKFPFARIVDGELKAIWSGVRAAMAALNGARGEPDISEEDREGVHAKIGKYYERFDRGDPPPLRQLSMQASPPTLTEWLENEPTTQDDPGLGYYLSAT